MIRQTSLAAFGALLLAGGGALAAQAAQDHSQHQGAGHPAWHAALRAAVDAPSRSAANRLRDQYRHPYETLTFFGVEPDDTVVELIPGGGWYTEILAPYLRQGGGTLYAAGSERGLNNVRTMMTANPALYGQIREARFPLPADAGADVPRVPDGSADVVLTFRNVHNFIMGDNPVAERAFRQAFAMLRPGGTLGIVDHRLPESADSARERTSGYLKVSTVRRLAEAAGFRYVGASEVNANPRDTTEHPEGVWTLPPTLRLGDTDRARYVAIGESDRMTLRFVRPE